MQIESVLQTKNRSEPAKKSVFCSPDEHQRLRSLNDLNQNLSGSVFLNFFSSITTRPIEAKFHVEPPWGGGTKACSMVQVT